MKFTILTLFPETFDSIFSQSILKRAIESDLISIEVVNIRDYSKFKHKQVDDVPYWWWAGMVMSCQPLFDCIEDIRSKANKKSIVIYLTPRGDVLKQESVEYFSEEYDEIILLCGHYEGIDQRVIDNLVDKEISIGEYVLTGGELPAAIFIDSVSRLLPEVLWKEDSHIEESFSKALNRKKEYPHYTRPQSFRGMEVPDILCSGNHKKIEEWRKDNLI